MNHISKLALTLATALATAMPLCAGVSTTAPERNLSGNQLEVSFGIVLDDARVTSNSQIYITPVISDGTGNELELPGVLVNGRNMHYLYERGTVKVPQTYTGRIAAEYVRHKGPQTESYTATVGLQRWMLGSGASLHLVVDSCGCGRLAGHSQDGSWPLNLNPAGQMTMSFVTPAVTEQPVTIHEGRARVQFEVDRTELHDSPFVCRNGQRIDNTAQLAVIDDSVRYALSDPNVEIAAIEVCGFASPESPYLHNMELSTGRSRALAMYLADKYELPEGSSKYDAVAENWDGFRAIVRKSGEITEVQRDNLLELIDRPVYGPSDYDAKERELKTDSRFASLYRNLILPEWFPQLRATEFRIKTRLRPLDDKQLAQVLKEHPEMMTLNQMMRVARLYPEGSDQFNEVILKALGYYPDDEVANLNAAVAAMRGGDVARARLYISRAGNSPEAENVRGVIAAIDGDFEAADAHFVKAGSQPDAAANRKLIRF